MPTQGRDRMRIPRSQDQPQRDDQNRRTGQTSRRNPRPRRNFFGNLLKTLSLMTTGGTIAIGLIILAGMWQTGNQFFGKVSSLFNAPQPEPQVDVRSMVVQQIRNASELTTAVFTMETVVPASRDRTVGGYVIGKTTLLYIAYGEVRAGVDLAELKPEDVQVSGDTTILRLPPPRIFDSKIDVSRSKVYDYDRGFLGLGPDAAPQLQELAQRETLDKVVASACANGILQSASDRAKMTVTQLLMTAGYPRLIVESQPALVCQLTPPTLPVEIPPQLQPQPAF
jgi:Protein of unknown function (DUF4230)